MVNSQVENLERGRYFLRPVDAEEGFLGEVFGFGGVADHVMHHRHESMLKLRH